MVVATDAQRPSLRVVVQLVTARSRVCWVRVHVSLPADPMEPEERCWGLFDSVIASGLSIYGDG